MAFENVYELRNEVQPLKRFSTAASRMIIGLRRVRQIIDESDRNAVPLHGQVAGEHGTRREFETRYGRRGSTAPTSREERYSAARSVRASSRRWPDSRLRRRVSLRELALQREVPLHRVAGALEHIDAGGLNLYGTHHRRAEHIKVAESRNEVIAVERLRDVSRADPRRAGREDSSHSRHRTCRSPERTTVLSSIDQTMPTRGAKLLRSVYAQPLGVPLCPQMNIVGL